MAKDIENQENKQGQKEIQASEVQKTTSFVNAGTDTLKQPESLQGKFTFPIMKNAAKLPEIIQLNKPNEERVLEAHNDVHLKLSANSFRHPRRVNKADRKYEFQKRLLTMRNEAYEPNQNNLKNKVRTLSQLDLKKLMYDKSDKSPDEKLLEHYRDLRDSFAHINAYDKAVSALKKKENPTERDKARRIREEAHLRTLIDIRSYYQVMEELMLNRYYALLPREDMMKLSYDDLRERLDKLFKEEPDNRKKDLISYYQCLIRLKQLDIKDGKSIEEKEKQYQEELKDETPVDQRKPADEIKKIASSYGNFLLILFKKKDFYSAGDIAKRRALFFDTYAKDIDKFRNAAGGQEITRLLTDYDIHKANPQAARTQVDMLDKVIDATISKDEDKLEIRSQSLNGIHLTDIQKEGMRQIQSFFAAERFPGKGYSGRTGLQPSRGTAGAAAGGFLPN